MSCAVVSAQQSAFSTGTTSSTTTGVTPKGNTKISGQVLDSLSSKPVEFANVALIDVVTKKPVNGTVCDADGKFTITKVAEGNYSIDISFIGYETTTIGNISVEEKKNEINLGTITLRMKEEILKEVVVEGQKAIIEERVDRTVYNAENDQTARGGDATDVLKRVPMLSVDLDGNVSMRGSSNVMVLINNKPSTIVASSVADALKQIPADQIKSVEVITSPSAKYDAEGTGGIINIITKKNTLQGATLNVDAGVGLRGSNLGLNGNYRTGKMGFSLGGWGRANYNVNGRFENEQTSLNDGNTTVSSQKADTRNQGLFGNYTLGWDYDINEKNSLAASVRLGARNNNSWQDDLYSQNLFNNTSSSSLQNVKTIDESNNVDVNLTYTKTFEKPQKEFSILGSYSRNNRNNDFTRRTLEVNEAAALSGIKNNNDSYNEEMTIQADYVSPINTNQIVEFGAKNITRKVFSDFKYAEDPEGDGSYTTIVDAIRSNNLNYNQNVTSGYLSYTLAMQNGYSIKAGSRYEYTVIDAYTKTEDDIDIPAYGVFVPSVNLSKKLKQGNMIKASYNRRIQRPSIQFLNPNIQNSNPLSQSVGNPQLDPEYTNNFEISYSTYIKGTSLNFSTFWRNTNNSIQSIRTPKLLLSGQEGIETTYANIGQEDAYGLSTFANVNIGKLSLNGGFDVYYSMLDNNIETNPDAGAYSASNEGWVASYRLFGNYNLSKGWGFQFFGFYRGRQVQLQGYQTGFGIYSLGLKKDFNNKKGSVGFGAENFFTPAFKVRGESSSPVFEQKSLNVFHNMSFRANISYRIGKMNMDARPKRRRSINNDDLKDGGGDGGGDMGGGQQRGGNSSGFTPQVTPKAKAPAAATAKPTTPGDSTAVVKAEGKWAYTIESPQGGEGVLTITKEGEQYAGTIFNKRFNSNLPLTSVTVSGNELSFSYHVSFGGNEMDIMVKAIINGDAFSGNMAVGQFGTFPINATREP
ncbi:TonB-dependent receptor [Pseudochryseolinea flava]|uniref:TonB-dependent receptor n=2 Tax=Pseudochryseolinea flava TaxID=2059302 RepID=A0A364Y214_9BACT|nr:TonB-dependent receptor [Pseudochryseolinea flava]